MTTFSVTNTLNAGNGSLRQAIISSNAATAATNTITFNISNGGVQTISPTSPLPAITQPVVIDGTTQPGTQNGPRIVLDGSGAGSTAGGLSLDASNSTVKGLAIDHFAVAGIVVNGASHDVISGDSIGVAAGGLLAGPDTNGVMLMNGANANTIGGTTSASRDVISGNLLTGVVITGAGTNHNLIEGDFIGTDSTGATSLSNVVDGVDVLSGASSNTIGGTSAPARNVLSGNGNYGLYIAGSSTVNNLVEGNDIGVDATGARALRNSCDGVDVVYGASSNTIGGMTAGASNVISGNAYEGVFISDPGTMNNLVEGDYIGTDVTGIVAIPNGDSGVIVIDNASRNMVGGTTAAARNVISGNADSGIAIKDTGTMNNLVVGNYIGTDATGIRALPNGLDGVDIRFGASNNTIGGTSSAARNVVSGNGNFGLYIADAGTVNNLVAGNYIGVNVTGVKGLLNVSDGIEIIDCASSNTIGGTSAGARNVISGNGGNGLIIGASGTINNLVAGDYIGTDSTGGAALPNGVNGVEIVDGASRNTVGGTTSSARDVIAGNSRSGLYVSDTGTTNNVIAGDYIGTDVNGTARLGNVADGVVLTNGATSNTIGGTSTGAGNVISANGIDGVQLDYAGTAVNTVEGDYIGTDTTGTHALGNGRAGVYIWSGASANTVGGTAAGAGNVISGNGQSGVTIDASYGNLIAGDNIGTDKNGAANVGNLADGVMITNGSAGNMIGGYTGAARDVISANGVDGVQIDFAGTSANIVAGDYIGTDSTGTHALGNSRDGVYIWSGASNNTIGGSSSGASDVISANGQYGVIVDAGSTLNSVSGDDIGTNASGTMALGNGSYGVAIVGGAYGNVIGGTGSNFGNKIEYNKTGGVTIQGAGSTNNVVEYDVIDDNVGSGVYISYAPGNSVLFCTIVSNTGYGILTAGSQTVINGNVVNSNLQGQILQM